MATSIDIRVLLMKALDNGMSQVDAAKFFNVSTVTIWTWKKRLAETGSLERSAPSPGAPPQVSNDAFLEYLSEEGNNGKTQVEIGKDLGVSQVTVCQMLKKLGLVRKKRPSPTVKRAL